MTQHEADHARTFGRIPHTLSVAAFCHMVPAVQDRRSADDADCRTTEIIQILTRYYVTDDVVGTVILDPSLRVLACSKGAAQLLLKGDCPLQLRQHELIAIGSPDACTRLNRLLELADGVTAVFSAGQHWLGISALAHPREHTIRVSLREIALPSGQLIERRLGQMFDLTRAEARLAGALAAGLSLNEAAQACGTRIGTARNYLNRVFRKTATSRQSQLVALICRAMVECPP